MTKMDASKFLPTKRETVVLKIYIHCDQCQKQVKKVIKKLDGIESVTIDPDMGKLTVVGTVTATILIKKLGKAGKFAAPWNSSYNYNTTNAMSPASYNTPNNYHYKNKDPHHRIHHYNDSKLPKGASDLLLNESTLLNGVNYNHADIRTLLSSNNSSSSRSSSASTCSNSSDFPKMSRSSSSENINPMDSLSNYNNMMFNLNNSFDQHNDHHIHNTASNRKSKGGKRVSFSLPNGVSLYNQYANLDTFSYTPSISDYYKSSETVEYATQMFSDENAHNCTIM